VHHTRKDESPTGGRFALTDKVDSPAVKTDRVSDRFQHVMKHWCETAAIVDRVIALASAGRRAALATVVRIEGSSYRRPGPV